MRSDSILTTVNELLFFDSKQDALPLYEAFREAVLEKVPDTRIEVKKNQNPIRWAVWSGRGEGLYYVRANLRYL